MRTIFLAGSVFLLTAGAALAEPPQPAPPPALPGAGGGAPPPATTYTPPAAVADAAVATDTAGGGARFWAKGDYLLMWYTPMRTPPLIQAVPSGLANVALPPGAAATIFPEDNHIDFGAFSGLRGSIGAGWDNYALEVGGLVLERKTERGSLFNNGFPVAVAQGYIAAGSGQPTSLFASLPNQYSGGVSVVADSRLWGAEANFRTRWYSFFAEWTDLIIGGKYLDLQERLAITAPSFFPNGNSIDVRDSISTRNTFYGGQIGFNSRLGGFERGFGIDFTSKSAVGGVHQRVDLVGSNTFVVGGVADVQSGGLYARGLNAGTFTRDKIAFLQDLDVRLTYNFNRWIQVSFGYSLIYLSSVMRPGDAIDPVINDNIRFVAAPTPTTLNRPAFSWRGSELVVQGMTFGVRVQY